MAFTISVNRRLAGVIEAAEYADCHPNTIRRHIKDGTLTAYRLGRNIRIDLDELDAVMTGADHIDAQALTEARRDLLAAKLEDQIKELVDAAPPLTEDQRRRLTAIIRAGAA